MGNLKLAKEITAIVKSAWKGILERKVFKENTSEWHFGDCETDVGFLKDLDAFNALIEPFNLAPADFIEPPLKFEEIENFTDYILKSLELIQQDENLSSKPIQDIPKDKYQGFSANPYPYIQQDVDYIDSASTFLKFVCNLSRLYSLKKKNIPALLEKRLSVLTTRAVDFLIESRIEDREGVRWQGVNRETNPAGKYANLFFTNVASLSMNRAIETNQIVRWIGSERRERIEILLKSVPKWVINQYDNATKAFWMDAARGMNQGIGIVHALEIIYTLLEPLPEETKEICSNALNTLFSKVVNLSEASALQQDFFHTIPLISGTVFYDDRRYIGSYLSLFTLAKVKHPDVISNEIIDAAEIIYTGVSDEWIDEPSNMWDDGRPLICYTYDAILGVINYGMGGKIDSLSFKENELRSAIKEALSSSDVIDSVYEYIRDRAKNQIDKSFTEKLRKAARSSRN